MCDSCVALCLFLISILYSGVLSAGEPPAAEKESSGEQVFPQRTDCIKYGKPGETKPSSDRNGRLSIEGLLNNYSVDPSRIRTLRPDVFKPGYFSIFDVLVAACKDSGITLRYHLDKKMRTHIIDSLDDKDNWWYAAAYDGGNRFGEEPVHRMDCHPYKDWMTINVYQVERSRLDQIHAVFKAEAARLKANKGKVVIPKVLIEAPGLDLWFTNVHVKPCGLRSDVFQQDVTTAADVILTLARNRELSLDLKWHERLGRSLVQGYYVIRFDNKEAHGCAGFTYEIGEAKLRGDRRTSRGSRFGNNNFHMTSDLRVIVSPEYMWWKWVDLSRRGGGRRRW